MGYKTKSIDDLGARAGVFKKAGESIETPFRVLTSKENEQGDRLESKHLVAGKIFYDSPFVQFTRNFNPNTLESFATQSQVSFSLEQELKDFAKKHPNAFPIFHPNIPSYVSLETRGKTTKKPLFLGAITSRKLMQAQINAGYEIITVQDKHASSSSKDLEKRIKDSQGFLDESGFEAGELMVKIRTSMDDQLFKDKLAVIEDTGIKMMILEASSVGSYLPNLKYITKFARRNEDILIHGSQTDRIWRGNKATSMMHFNQAFSYDSYAVKLMPPIPIDKPLILRRKNAKLFDVKPLGFIIADEYEKTHGNDLGVECPITQGMNIDDFFNTFTGVQELRSALNVREFFNSASEFENSRPYIIGQDYRGYAKTKALLVEAWNKVLGVDLKSSSLSKWFK